MNDEDFVRFFSRHLVSLSGWYHATSLTQEESGQLQFFSYSGFIVSFHGLWCLATAGHILEDLEQHLRERTLRVVSYALLDDFGPEVISHDPIPFDYGRAPKYYINNKEAGLDFALIGLSSYYQGLLQANGIVAISQENWEKQHEVDFGKYMMIGLPQKAIEASTSKSQGKVHFEAFVRPMTIDIEKLDELPEGTRETSYPRFIGKIDGEKPIATHTPVEIVETENGWTIKYPNDLGAAAVIAKILCAHIDENRRIILLLLHYFINLYLFVASPHIHGVYRWLQLLSLHVPHHREHV